MLVYRHTKSDHSAVGEKAEFWHVLPVLFGILAQRNLLQIKFTRYKLFPVRLQA